LNLCRIKIRTILWLPVFTAILFSACAEEKQAAAASPATTIKNLTGEILPSWLPKSLVFNLYGDHLAYAAMEDEMWGRPFSAWEIQCSAPMGSAWPTPP
jgi:hypothetical protein